MIELGSTWKTVVRKAWSIRFIALSFLCDTAGIVLIAVGTFSGSPGQFVWLQIAGAGFNLAAFVARLTKQKSVT